MPAQRQISLSGCRYVRFSGACGSVRWVVVGRSALVENHLRLWLWPWVRFGAQSHRRPQLTAHFSVWGGETQAPTRVAAPAPGAAARVLWPLTPDPVFCLQDTRMPSLRTTPPVLRGAGEGALLSSFNKSVSLTYLCLDIFVPLPVSLGNASIDPQTTMCSGGETLLGLLLFQPAQFAVDTTPGENLGLGGCQVTPKVPHSVSGRARFETDGSIHTP